MTKFLTKRESSKRRELEAFLNGIFLTRPLDLRLSLAIHGGTSQLESVSTHSPGPEESLLNLKQLPNCL